MIDSDQPYPTQAPYPGTKAMPQWDVGELKDAPIFTSRNLLAMIGPGLVMGAAAIGGGEWLAGPAVTAKYGGALLWVGTISILFQVIYNIEISRYTLYTGEPIFTGKFRLPPHPMFWLVVYLLLDWGSIAPYLITNAAVPVEAIWLQRLPNHEANASDWWMHKWLCTGMFLLLLIPLTVGGKIYDSLKWVMSFKLIAVMGFLLFCGVFFAKPSSWADIFTGLFKVGNVPVLKGEDLNGNGVLDPGEDFDGDGHLDIVEKKLPPTIDKDGDGKPETWADNNGDGKVDDRDKFEDADGDGTYDGNNVENVFIELVKNARFPEVDLSLIAMIAGLAAIAGNGGLTNTPISNFTRDQGWGMGDKVGAIPSVVGGHGITLSHVGCVFLVSKESLERWKRWVAFIARDQVVVWMGACLIGVSLPSILSVEFLKRGTDASEWNLAALTAGGVQSHVTEPPEGVLAHSPALSSVIAGPQMGKFMWGATLFCGFLVLITSQTTTMDGFVRRWVDVMWTASPQLRKLKSDKIKYVYFWLLMIYSVLGLAIIWATEKPGFVFKLATTGYNFAFAISAWHTLFVNTILLPKELRPGWLQKAGLVLAGVFFLSLGIMSALKLANIVK
jgi:hypothetical protein